MVENNFSICFYELSAVVSLFIHVVSSKYNSFTKNTVTRMRGGGDRENFIGVYEVMATMQIIEWDAFECAKDIGKYRQQHSVCVAV